MLDPSDDKQNKQLQDIIGVIVMLFLMFTYCGMRPGDPRPAPPEDVHAVPLKNVEDPKKPDGKTLE